MKVIVIGAGVVGCAIAHALASRGALVQLVDGRGIGMGATRASAGILAPTIEGHVPALLSLGVRSLSMYDEFIRIVSADGGQPVEYDRNGTLQVALNAEELDDLRALARTFAAEGVRHSVVGTDDARRLEPALPESTTGGLLVPQHGYVAVGQMTRALAQAARNRGAETLTAHVLGVDGGDTPRVRIANQFLDGDAVVIAAGSWTDQIVPRADATPAVKPIRGQLLQVRLERRPASHVVWGKRCYAVPWRDGSVLVGATVEDAGFDERATVAGVHELLGEAVRLLPPLRDAALEEVRVGLRPMTKDELPAIGPSSTMRNVFYATGHYRNGVLLAPLTAALVADLVLEGRRDDALAVLGPDRLGL